MPGYKILIADVDENERNFLAQLIQRQGDRAIQVSSGRKCRFEKPASS